MVGDHAASCQVHYCLVGATNGIAINKDNSAFAKVNLVVNVNGNAAVVISSLVSLGFAHDSHLIQSVAWCILKDVMGTPGSESANESKSDSTAKESLESQIVYPSVVSFDEAQREKAKDRLNDAGPPGRQGNVDHMEDPGMSI